MKLDISHYSAIALTTAIAGIALFPGVTSIIGLIMVWLFAGKLDDDPEAVSADPHAMLFFVGMVACVGSVVRLIIRYVF